MLVIDILAVGVTMRRSCEGIAMLGGQADERLDESGEAEAALAFPQGANSDEPGVSEALALALARMTSHSR